MKRPSGLITAMGAFLILLVAASTAYSHGVAELKEGTVRQVYVDKPLIGAKGIIVGDWHNGQVRVEVQKFPASDMGYEVFLVNLNIPAYVGAMFVDGNSQMGIVANPPPFSAVGKLIRSVKSLGDLEMDGNGNGTLNYSGGDNLFEAGYNMVMIFGKVTAGPHEGPEDFSKLMVECNGPLPGTKESRAMMPKVFSK